MANLCGSYYINRAILSVVLLTFSISYSVPINAAQFQLGLNEVAFMVRMEKLVEKLVKCKDKPENKIIENLINIKTEIESSCNVKFNLDQYMDQVSHEISKSGQKASKKQMDAIKKKLKRQDKTQRSHVQYISRTMYTEDYQFNIHDEKLMSSKRDHKDKEKEKDDDVEIPTLLIYGVTVTLCGLFLMVLPVPACKDWGGRMVVAGVTACANSISSKTDENKKDKDKK